MASMAALTDRPVIKVDRAIQSNFAIQDDWVDFVRSLHGQSASHLLNHQAVAEVIVRLYCKGAAEWQAKAAAYAGSGIAGRGSSSSMGSGAISSRTGTPWGQGTAAGAAPGSGYGNRNPLALAAAAGAAAAAAAAGGSSPAAGAGAASTSSSTVNGRSMGLAALTDGGGSGGTVFDLLTAHYSQAGKPGGVGNVAAVAAAGGGGPGAAAAGGGGAGAAAAYAAHLWKDPSGPVARLLLSCQQYAAADLKVALFCR
jgi:hypothetical protein